MTKIRYGWILCLTILLVLMGGQGWAQCNENPRVAKVPLSMIGSPPVEDLCDTASQYCETYVTASNQNFGVDDTDEWKASTFQASVSDTICSVVLYMRRTGTPSCNVSVAIYTENSGNPGTLVGSWSDPVAASTFSVAPTYDLVEFPNISASLTATTKYWIVVKASSYDGSNYPTVRANTGCDWLEGVDYSGDGVSWTSANQTVGFIYFFYK